ncbi:MAG: DUF11 domain-containing protein, partial [Dehalococcoidia bacterium]|nr:DUF11 domain-containing protein [Dehalococcoidia bacterium]
PFQQLSTYENPVLTLSITPPLEGMAGQNVTYYGSVHNISSNTAYNSTLTWQIPPEFTYVSSSGGTYNPATRTVSIMVPSITAGEEITGYVTVKINPATPDGTIVMTNSTLTWDNILGDHLGPVTNSSSLLVHALPYLNLQLDAHTYAFAGENVVYNGILSNPSTGTALNSVLVFQLDSPAMSFISSSHAAAITADNVTFNLGNFPAGANMTGSITVHIDEATPDSTVLQMVTLLYWRDALGNTHGPELHYHDLVVYQRPQLEITKEGSDWAVIGSSYTFTGTLTNVGLAAAENVVLVDYLPVGLTYLGSSHSAVYDPVARTVTWILGKISHGSSIPGWISVLVDNITSGSSLVNNFQVKWTDNLANPYGPALASKEIIVYSTPKIKITKEGPGEATVGSYITFTGTLSNVGGLSAENVVLMDRLPVGLTFVSSSHTAVYNAETHTIIWNIGHVGSGVDITGWVTVQVDSSVADGTHLVNGFSTSWRDGSNNSYGPASASTEIVCHTHPLITLEKTGPLYGKPGSPLIFSFTATNSGGLSAKNVSIMDFLPTRYTYISSDPPGVFSGGSIVWNVDSIAPHASRTFTLTVLVHSSTPDNTPITNTSSVAWQDEMGNAYGPAGASATVTIYSSPQLIVSKTGPASASASDNCTYNIALTNISDAPAVNVMLNDIVPSFMDFVSCTSGGIYDPVTGVVNWNLGTVAGNSTRTVTLVLSVDPALIQSQTLINSVLAVWQDLLGTDYGPSPGTCRTIVAPYPALTVLVSGPASGAQSSQLTYTVTITNTSATQTASNVLAMFMLPSGSNYLGSSDRGTFANGTVQWIIGYLSPGATRQMTVVITLGNAAGSSVILTGATSWQHPAGTAYGPRFSNLSTYIESAVAAPPKPTRRVNPMAVTPPRSAAATTGPQANPPPVYLPCLNIEHTSISTDRVESGMPVEVTALIKNRGSVYGSSTINVYINGYVESVQGITLAGGEQRELVFILYRDEPGIYSVYVDGEYAGDFVVNNRIGGYLVLIISWVCFLVAFVLGIIMIRRRHNSES